jgi:hypothetical protein
MTDQPKLGYRQPPAEYRFKPGQSGNPRGRPKKKVTMFDDAAAIFGRPVTGSIEGKAVSLPMTKAIFRGLCRKALSGDKAALRRVFELSLTLQPPGFDPQPVEALPNLRAFLAKNFGETPEELFKRVDQPAPKLTPEEKAAKRSEDVRINKAASRYRQRLEADRLADLKARGVWVR